jgi:uncharacterized SAM-binding protein YcdF (DUF218 family)
MIIFNPGYKTYFPMFFFLSKLLTFLLSPLVWVFVLLFLALFNRKARRRKKFLISGIFLLYLFSNEFICNEVYRSWEYPFTKLDNAETYDYAVVLGGFSNFDQASSRVKFNEAGDRFIQSYQLYQEGKVKKIFISGGSGSVLHQDETEADKVKDFLISLKVPDQDIVIEKASRNTHENAVNTADWLAKNDPHAKCLLATSATHMRRALGCYKRAGINVTPYTTHRLTDPRKFDPDTLFLPNAKNLMKWDIFLKELVGIVIYKVAGYI